MLALQFGQCGNQVGQELFSQIATDLYSPNTGVSSSRNSDYVQLGFDKWFRGVSTGGKHLARAVLVDTEQKVIGKLCSGADSISTWSYSPQNIVCQAAGGSANNWGFGYAIKGPKLGAAALEAIRREVERVDSFQGILALLSTAGGTGSGVGSHVMERVREEFPTKTIASGVVLPYVSGEVGTQNYNTLLTLAKFIDVSDVVFTFENDQIHTICENLIHLQNTTLNDLNHIIACKLAAVLQPISGTPNSLASLVYHLTPHPQYKIATIKTSPIVTQSPLPYNNSGYKWQSIFRHLKQMLRAPALDLELVDMETRLPTNSTPARTNFVYSKSVSNLLISRGSVTDDDDPLLASEVSDGKLYADWVPSSRQFLQLHQQRRLLSKDKCAVLVTNNSQLQKPINAVVEKAWNSYVHSAFLHQYKQYGVSEDDFLHAFAKIENLIKVYRELYVSEDNNI